ncbi:hypothetical protein [Bosea sp. BH3]|nr:hypothetical protein [Bosea sp. BH3]
MTAILPIFGILGFVAFAYALLDASRSVSGSADAADSPKPSLIS